MMMYSSLPKWTVASRIIITCPSYERKVIMLVSTLVQGTLPY